jgi:molecular chaperone DnaK
VAYRLGVDLGTTYTAAAVVEDGQQPHLLGLGNRAMQIPSALYLQPDGTVLVGEVAERRGASDPSRLVREVKRRIGDPVSLLIAGSSFTAEALTANILRWVVGRATQRMGGPPEHVVATHPANWGPYKLELMHQVVALADLPSASLLTEPEAAAAQYASRSRVPPESRIAVYDLGGGTFDACVLAKTPAGFEVLGRPEGIEHLGGIDFDEAVFRHVVAAMGGLDGLDVGSEEVLVGLNRLRRDCVEAKEALTEELDAEVPITIPGRYGPVRITRVDLESLVRPALLDTHIALNRAMRSAGVGASDLLALVLVGGSSRMPIVGQLLEQELGLPVSLDAHPKHDVALGALRASARAVTRPVKPQPSFDAPGLSSEHGRPAPADARAEHGATPESAGHVAPKRAPVASTAPVDRVEDEATSPATATPRVRWRAPGEREEPKPVPEPAPDPEPVPEPEEPGTAVMPPVPPEKSHRSRWPLLIGAGVVAAVIVASLAWLLTDRGGDVTDRGGNGRPVGPRLPDRDFLLAQVVNGHAVLQVVDTEDLSSHPQTITNRNENASSAALSPDRRTIVYISHVNSTYTVRIMGTNGDGDRQLFPSSVCHDPGRPAWDPTGDGDHVVLTCDFRKVIRVDLGGTADPKPLATGDHVQGPTVNGKGEVAYIAAPPGRSAGTLMLTNTAGRAPVQVTHPGDFVDIAPAWSPDGTRIAVARSPSAEVANEQSNLWVVGADGSGGEQITKQPGVESVPSWSPDGKALVFRASASTSATTAKIEETKVVPYSPDNPPPQTWLKAQGGDGVAPLWSRR